MMNRPYKKPVTDIGELRTPVEFYESKTSGPEPNQTGLTKLFYCYAEVYNPSMKDLEIMHSTSVKQGITIKIRDPLTDYQPQSHHVVIIDDFRYKNMQWNITDIRTDVQNSEFITVLLGADA